MNKNEINATLTKLNNTRSEICSELNKMQIRKIFAISAIVGAVIGAGVVVACKVSEDW